MSHHDHPSHEAPQSQEHGKPTDSTQKRDDAEQERATADETKAGLK